MNKELEKSVYFNNIDSNKIDSSTLGYKAIVDKGEVKIVTLDKPGKQASYKEIRETQLKNR